jgi:4a-hydroxytetrahydrobiopterin dehydratase
MPSMPKAPLLSDEEITSALRTLTGWERDGGAFVKTYRFADFRSAVDFLARITPVADAQNHHPDVAIHWNELTLRLWTHASGGPTERDVRLARALNEMTEDAGAEA